MKLGKTKHSNFDRLFDELDLVPETDKERRTELVALGVDVDAARQRFEEVVRQHERGAVRRDLEAADRERTEYRLRDRVINRVREMGLSTAELMSRLGESGPAFAHRELRSWSRTDLESAYADKLALEGFDDEDGE